MIAQPLPADNPLHDLAAALLACVRQAVADRMERAGMHWTAVGAQAMLELRSTYVNGDWETYQAHWIDRETRRLYPHRDLVAGANYCLPA